MLDVDKQMVIKHIVEKVFIPDVMVQLQPFIAQMVKQSIESYEWYKEVGFAPAHQPINLDLRNAQDKLAQAIVIATKEQPLLK